MSDPPLADADEVAALLHTALYDTDGEMIESGFVDRWEPNSLVAIDQLHRLFERRGYTVADETLLRAAVTAPKAPNGAAVSLLTGLRRFTQPLIDELDLGDSAEGRAAAVRAQAKIRGPEGIPARLKDRNPLVRLAAVQAVIENSRRLPDANALLIEALRDEDFRVRLKAAKAINFWNDPDAANVLLHQYETDESSGVRRGILTHIVENVRREGTHHGADSLRERMGTGIQSFLLAHLDHPEPEMRYEVGRSLERLACDEVCRAFLQRLRLEQVMQCRRGLLFYPTYHNLPDESLPILILLLSDPDPGVRGQAAFTVEWFGAPVVPHLMRTLDDSEAHVRRAAAMSLGKCKAGVALPLLLRELWDPRNHACAREFESAVRDTAFYLPEPQEPPDTTLSVQIQARIDALECADPAVWHVRVCKEDLNALPLHANSAFQWCLRPDGTVLRWDFDSIRVDQDPETDARSRFAVLVHGAVRYPELTSLIPKLPDKVRLCNYCRGRGWTQRSGGAAEPCLACNCLGWSERQ